MRYSSAPTPHLWSPSLLRCSPVFPVHRSRLSWRTRGRTRRAHRWLCVSRIGDTRSGYQHLGVATPGRPKPGDGSVSTGKEDFGGPTTAHGERPSVFRFRTNGIPSLKPSMKPGSSSLQKPSEPLKVPLRRPPRPWRHPRSRVSRHHRCLHRPRHRRGLHRSCPRNRCRVRRRPSFRQANPNRRCPHPRRTGLTPSTAPTTASPEEPRSLLSPALAWIGHGYGPAPAAHLGCGLRLSVPPTHLAPVSPVPPRPRRCCVMSGFVLVGQMP